MTAGTSAALPIHGKQSGRTPRIGLALGGGGARGLAHIAMLEAFDELGIRPSIIAGTSIGALYGAAYASGLSGKDLRDHTRFILAQRFGLIRDLFIATAQPFRSARRFPACPSRPVSTASRNCAACCLKVGRWRIWHSGGFSIIPRFRR